MIQKLYAQFEGLVTRWKDKLTSDPFLVAQIKIAILYFIVGTVVSIIISDIADRFLRDAVYEIARLDTGPMVELAFIKAEQELWFWRGVKLILLVVAAYFLARYALRPVKKSAELQKRFSATVSHELKTPIAVMKNSIEVALRHEEFLTREKAISILKSNREEIEELSNLTDFLMVFSGLKNKKRTFMKEEINLRVKVEKAIEKVKDTMGQDVSIVIKAPESVFITGSKAGVVMLITNLLKNAVAHSTTGFVEVSLADEGPKISLVVRDNGSGILEEDLPYIFEPFYRGASESGGKIQNGLGLGLTIVKEIVEMHHATLTVKSEKGVGTVFAVIFPKNKS
ncbi:MAG: HAMP domain-containing sensor histidine kinase [Patescibacteria group bacterium]